MQRSTFSWQRRMAVIWSAAFVDAQVHGHLKQT
jgi:hypothetical protein